MPNTTGSKMHFVYARFRFGTSHASTSLVQSSLNENIGIDRPDIIISPKYHKSMELGNKTIVTGQTVYIEQEDAATVTADEEITLKNWGNASVRKLERGIEGGPITSLTLELNLQGDVRKTKKLTWLAATESNIIPIDLVSFDLLITTNKLEKTDSIEEFLTPVTEFRVAAFADCNVAELKDGDIVQFERK